ncbi:HD-GYP domain-containing protein [Paenibacillus sp. FSL W8-1187]|uniref:GAF domain/HD domain protein n=1 Tax=Paenibacillus pasadenensis TaxID=217090 RepID=A0A2N5NDS4_9BACL|nr:HD-GYP domain-containing protein [Paenibacillus pasadenensis]PLT48489.1 GAF domain/HD domain protein [Paenibacillus pasadenensis]
MRRPAVRMMSVALVSFLLPLGMFLALRESGGFDPRLHAPIIHFYIVSGVSFLALLLAAALGYAGMRLRNFGIAFLSLAYVSMTGLLMLHGLATPGFLMDHNSVQGVSSQLGILAAAGWIWLSSLPAARRMVLRLGNASRWLAPAYTLLLLAFLVFSLQGPHTMHDWALDLQGSRPALTGLVLALLAHAAWSYARNYRSARMPLQLGILYGCGLLAAGQVVMVSGEPWRLSWWLYHVLLLLSLVSVAWGLGRQLAGSRGSLSAALRALYRSTPQEWLQKCISPSVEDLIEATEQKDGYTAGHNYRVALYALKLAEKLDLAPEQLLAIGQGAIVHDVGKLYVPEAILNKPAALSPEERQVVELHPVRGYELCRNLGFMRQELAVVRSHHERWDGTGYPDRLEAEQIPLTARIAAVADVYDALTSQRAYRRAMTPEQALAFIGAESGRHFDPACVAAWLELAEEEPEFFARMTEEEQRPLLGRSRSVPGSVPPLA